MGKFSSTQKSRTFLKKRGYTMIYVVEKHCKNIKHVWLKPARFHECCFREESSHLLRRLAVKVARPKCRGLAIWQSQNVVNDDGSWLEMSGKGSDLVFEFYLSMLLGLCFDVLSYTIIYIYISSWEWAMCHELKKKGGSENWFRPRNRHGVPAGTCRTCQSDLHVFFF